MHCLFLRVIGAHGVHHRVADDRGQCGHERLIFVGLVGVGLHRVFRTAQHVELRRVLALPPERPRVVFRHLMIEPDERVPRAHIVGVGIAELRAAREVSGLVSFLCDPLEAQEIEQMVVNDRPAHRAAPFRLSDVRFRLIVHPREEIFCGDPLAGEELEQRS